MRDRAEPSCAPTARATVERWLMQFQADVLGVPVSVPEVAETTALGAAYLAGVGIGAWTIDAARSADREKDRYEPRCSAQTSASACCTAGRRALERARGWAEA